MGRRPRPTAGDRCPGIQRAANRSTHWDRTCGRAFVACDASVVAVLDLASDSELGRLPIAGQPDAIWYSSATDRLYIAIAQPGVIDVVDGRTLAVVDQVTTEEGAHTTAF